MATIDTLLANGSIFVKFSVGPIAPRAGPMFPSEEPPTASDDRTSRPVNETASAVSP